MPSYESIIIVKPQLSDEQVHEVLEKSKKLLADNGGEVLAEDRWGRRKLAYPIEKVREGFYAYVKFQAPAPALDKLSHHFRVSDDVLRATTVRSLRPQRPPKKLASPKPAAPVQA